MINTFRAVCAKGFHLLFTGLLLTLFAPSAFSTEIEIAQLNGFVHDSDGLVTQLDSSSASFFSTLDGNNLGTFGWSYSNTGSTTLTDVRFFVFLDADLDRSLNTAFNEYGEVAGQALPPGSPANALLWSSFQIDEPGFVSGTIFSNLLAGALDNTNHVPPGTTDDVSFALGFVLVSLAPGQQFTAQFQISTTDIGGLQQTDPDSNSSFYFNGFATAPASGPNNTPPPSGVPEPSTGLLVVTTLIGFLALGRREWRRLLPSAFLAVVLTAISTPAEAQMSLTTQGIAAGFKLTQFVDGFAPNLFGSGPLGIAFPNSGGVLVGDSGGNVWLFPNDIDGQHTSGVVVRNYGLGSALGLTKANDRLFMTLGFNQLAEINNDGTFKQTIVFISNATGVATNPANGHIFVSDQSSRISDVDINTKTVTVFKNVGADGITFSPDGSVLYCASGSSVYGFRVSDAAQVFAGSISSADGTAIGTGSLAGLLFVNTTDGRVVQVNLATGVQTVIANGGSRGDFVSVDPNGSLLITQSDRVLRITPPLGGGFGGSNPVISNLTTRFKDSSVDIVWSPPSPLPSGGKIISYNLYRRKDSAPFAQIKSGLSVTNFTDVGLGDGTTYYYVVRWLDGNGVESKDSTEMSATPTSTANRAAGNTPPTILSNPNITAAMGKSYSYPLKASDPDTGDVLSYSLPTSLAGMTIDATGLIAWTPTASQAGTVTAKARVQDKNGNFSTQQWQISVQAAIPTSPPVISSSALLSGTVGKIYSYQVVASDPNAGAILTYSLTSMPVGMTITGNSGLAQWVPTAAQVGPQGIVVRVQDQFGLSATQSFSVRVASAPVLAPAITSTPVTSIPATAPYTYQVTATNPNSSTLTFSLVSAPTGMTIGSATGIIQWTPTASQEGTQSVTVKVQDATGQSGSQLFTVQVTAPMLPPTITITSPPLSSVVTQVTNIVGSITDPNPPGVGGPLSWTLGVLKPGSSSYQTIATGATPVSNATIGQFDPTILPNNTYPLRVTVTQGPFTRTVDFALNVAGNLKLGNFTTQFTDLSIPVAGIPITITRRYDNLDTSKGEFGSGWRLALPGQVSDNAGTGPYSGLTRVYVTRPDGKRIGFTFNPTFAGTFLPVWFPDFKPDAGVTEKLAVPPSSLFNTNGAFFDLGGPFNPTSFTLTTKEGVQYGIDKNLGLQKITDTNGNTLTVTPGGLVSSTGVTLAFQRDAQNRITKIIEPGPTPGTLQYGYDAGGNLTSFTDQNGNSTNYFYENATFPNYLTKLVDPLGRPLLRNVYDATGRITAQCDANGNTTTLAGCVTFNPNAPGKLQTIVNARGFRTDLILDANGNVLTERRWLDAANFLDTVRAYDANNNLLTQTDPAGNKSVYTYDIAGNRLTETDPLVHTTAYTYNACNKVLTTTDPAGNVTTNTYDSNCNLLTVKNALGAVTTYKYNAQGQQSDFIDAVGSHWVWAYDASGYLASLTDPFGKATTFNFSPTGDLLKRVDRNNRRIDFQYDNAHHLVKETWDTTPARVTNYTYNAAGQLASATDPDSALALTYINLGQLGSVDNNGTPNVPRVVMSYAYDANGNVASVNDSLGGVAAYSYDALDRQSRITQSGTGVNPKRVDYQYDNASFLTRLSRFSDLAGAQPVINTLFETDCAGCPGRITAIRHRRASDNSVLHDLTFSRTALGDISASADVEGTHNYSYDMGRQLLSATHANPLIQPNELYAIDPAGNRTSSHLSNGYIYSDVNDKGNRLVRDDHAAYEYDGEGNLTRTTLFSDGNYTVYTYDYRNRPQTISLNTATNVRLANATFTYDPLNRRIVSAEGGQSIEIAYDGLNPVLKVSPDGTLAARRLYARTLDSLLAEQIVSENRWHLTDSVGSTRDLASNAGTVINHYAYDSFGRVVRQTVPGTSSDIGFSSRESLSSGVDYFRARLYDPALGRFSSEDPLLPFAYSFANNNPLSFSDPLGQSLLEFGITVNESVGRVGCVVSFITSVNEFIKKRVGVPPKNLFDKVVTSVGVVQDSLELAFGVFDVFGLAKGQIAMWYLDAAGVPESDLITACLLQ